jgi:CheY-like chemotaxis protein
VLILTAFGQRSDLLEALSAGANDYLTKPYDVTELGARVATLVRTSRLHEAQLQRERLLAVSADVGIAFTRGGEFSTVAERATQAIVDHIDASLAAIWTIEGEEVDLIAARGIYASRDLPTRTPIMLHPLRRVVTTGERWICARSPLDPDLAYDWLRDDVETFAAYPLVIDQRVLGMLVILSRKPLAQETIDSLQSVAHVIALGTARTGIGGARRTFGARKKGARRC